MRLIEVLDLIPNHSVSIVDYHVGRTKLTDVCLSRYELSAGLYPENITKYLDWEVHEIYATEFRCMNIFIEDNQDSI